MVNISTSRFDQVKWVDYGYPHLLVEDDCAIDYGANCLPIANVDDLAFQMILTFSSPEEMMSITPFLFNMQPLEMQVGFLEDQIAEELYGSGTFEIHPLTSTSLLVQWRGSIDMFEGVDEGTCFRLGFSVTYTDDIDGFTYKDFISKACFKKISTDGDDYCYTSLIEYRNEENGFGFYYCFTNTSSYYTNRVRMIAYLSRPQYPENRRVFVKADGAAHLVKSEIKKTYRLKTDYLDEVKHEVLRIALAHDHVRIVNKSIDEYFRQEDDYNIEWVEDMDVKTAPAGATLSITPYAAINSNCDTCDLPSCEILSSREDGSNFIFDQPGDTYFMSGAVIEIDLSEGVTALNCPGGLSYVLNEIDAVADEYIASVAIDALTGMATVTMETLAPDLYLELQTLFTYNITCADGECPLPGSVIGTISTGCPKPVAFDVVAGLTGAEITITPPVPIPECGVDWEIWNFELTVMIMSGTFTDSPMIVNFTLDDGYELGESYVFQTRSNCCDAVFSDYIAEEFNAAAPVETCGRFEVSYLGPPGPHVFNYTNCNGDSQNDFITTGTTKTICAYQTTPGTPDNLTGVTSWTYLGLC